MKILIADDSKLSRSYIKRILSVSGYSDECILEANNGKEALDMLETHVVQCLFLDINMPVMTGIELVEIMKAKNMLAKTEIVITSSLADQKCIEELMLKGVIFFLRKPFSPEAMAEITEILKGKAT